MKSDYEHMSEKEIRAQIALLEKLLPTGEITPAQANKLYDLRMALRTVVTAHNHKEKFLIH